VSSLLSDFTMAKHNNLVSVADSAKTVSNHHHGLTALGNQLVKCLLNLMLRLSVKSTGGLVEKQDTGFADEGSGDSNSLLLTSRELQTTFTNNGIEAFREEFVVFDESKNVCLSAAGHKTLVRLVFGEVCEVSTVKDVITNCS
jgi:hypothetical protein